MIGSMLTFANHLDSGDTLWDFPNSWEAEDQNEVVLATCNLVTSKLVPNSMFTLLDVGNDNWTTPANMDNI